jgi:nitrate/nitrite transporter NarK
MQEPSFFSVWFVFAVIVVIFAALWYSRQEKKWIAALPDMYCTSCGNVAPATRSLRGNSFITFLLIWFMIIPAIAYSIWRHSGPHDRCVACGKAAVIPLSSPIAQKALNDLNKRDSTSTASSSG